MRLAREPAGATIAEQSLGWKNTFGTGNAGDTITSGLEGAWTTTPTQWSNNFFENCCLAMSGNSPKALPEHNNGDP